MSAVKIFDDYPEFLQFIKTVEAPYRYDETTRNYWFGGSYEQAVEKANYGDTDLFRRASDILMNVEDTLLPSVEAYRDIPYYHGSRPNISAVLTGQPKSMYRREYVQEPSNHKPIRIFVDRVTTCTFSTDQILNRGVAILALVLALKRIRPVTLYVGESACNARANQDGCVAIALDLNNIDMSVLANALAGPSFYRRLLFTANNYIHKVKNPNSYKIDAEKTRKMLGWSTHDLIFEGMWATDKDLSLAISNPAQWARQRLEAMSVVLNNGATE